MNDVCHGRVIALGVAPRDEAKLIHELHEFRRIGLCLYIPNRSRMATRLVGTVNVQGDNCRRHGLKFLHRHRSGRVLRASDIHLHPNVRTSVQDGIFRHADSILVEDFFDRCEALPLCESSFDGA